MKRILYFSLIELELTGGPTVHTFNLIKGFQELDVEVLLICPKPATAIPEKPPCQTTYVRFFGFSPLRLFVFNCFSFFHVFSAIVRFRPDYLLVREMEGNISVTLAALLGRVPLFIDNNGPFFMDYVAMKEEVGAGYASPPGSVRGVIKLWRRFWRSFQYSVMRGMTSNTEGWRKKLSDEFSRPDEESITVTMHVDTSRFKPLDKAACRRELGISESALVLGYVGSFQPTHEITPMFDLLRWVVEQGVDATLVLVGGGNRSEAIKAEMAASSLKSHLKFTGWVHHPAIPNYINTFDIGFALMRSVKAYQTEAVLKVKEYIACNVPVLVNGGQKLFKNYPSDCYVCSESLEAEVMGKLVLEKVKSSNLRETNAGYEFICENFSLRQAADKTLRFMERRQR